MHGSPARRAARVRIWGGRSAFGGVRRRSRGARRTRSGAAPGRGEGTRREWLDCDGSLPYEDEGASITRPPPEMTPARCARCVLGTLRAMAHSLGSLAVGAAPERVVAPRFRQSECFHAPIRRISILVHGAPTRPNAPPRLYRTLLLLVPRRASSRRAQAVALRTPPAQACPLETGAACQPPDMQDRRTVGCARGVRNLYGEVIVFHCAICP